MRWKKALTGREGPRALRGPESHTLFYFALLAQDSEISHSKPARGFANFIANLRTRNLSVRVASERQRLGWSPKTVSCDFISDWACGGRS